MKDLTYLISWSEPSEGWLVKLCVVDATRTCSHTTLCRFTWTALVWWTLLYLLGASPLYSQTNRNLRILQIKPFRHNILNSSKHSHSSSNYPNKWIGRFDRTCVPETLVLSPSHGYQCSGVLPVQVSSCCPTASSLCCVVCPSSCWKLWLVSTLRRALSPAGPRSARFLKVSICLSVSHSLTCRPEAEYALDKM